MISALSLVNRCTTRVHISEIVNNDYLNIQLLEIMTAVDSKADQGYFFVGSLIAINPQSSIFSAGDFSIQGTLSLVSRVYSE